MKSFLLFLLVQYSYAYDFVTVCSKKDRPTGFDAIVKESLPSPKLKLGNKEDCEALAKKAKANGALMVTHDLVPLSLLEVFPNLKNLGLFLKDKTIDRIDLGRHPQLTSLAINARLQLSSTSGLLAYKNLSELLLVGSGNKSWLDAKDLSKLKLRSLLIQNLKIKNAKFLEKMTSLENVEMKNIKFDKPVNWKKLPHAKIKK